jgi:iron complex outermembrane receptor protein
MGKSFSLRHMYLQRNCSVDNLWYLPIYFVAVLSFVTSVLWAEVANAAQKPSDQTEMSLEQLMNVKVTSVSKKPQRVSESAAAVHVITSEDIRRSGATSIPELLRNVPGLNVARIDASKWAVSARGFNGLFSNKLC